MTVNQAEIRDVSSRYLERNPDETEALQPLFRALDEGHAITSRKEFRIGHVTVGAVVLDPANRVLLIRHKILDKWLLPGGHLEPVDGDLFHASLRELEEETGITWQRASCPPAYDDMPADIDIHTIPASLSKGEPEHLHFDFRYVHRVERTDVHLQIEEVTDFEWRPLADLPAELARKLVPVVSSGN
ncbi:NUDIX hydrolase [Actinoalloteichus caeruleus]|uniref:NUDIX hydrolase n=1 Tax=Actinoalloteichus cyanogriseus TaxID=2893586 RepID=UPI003AB0D9DF